MVGGFGPHNSGHKRLDTMLKFSISNSSNSSKSNSTSSQINSLEEWPDDRFVRYLKSTDIIASRFYIFEHIILIHVSGCMPAVLPGMETLCY